MSTNRKPCRKDPLQSPDRNPERIRETERKRTDVCCPVLLFTGDRPLSPCLSALCLVGATQKGSTTLQGLF